MLTDAFATDKIGPKTRGRPLEGGQNVCGYGSGREADARTRTGDHFITSDVERGTRLSDVRQGSPVDPPGLFV